MLRVNLFGLMYAKGGGHSGDKDKEWIERFARTAARKPPAGGETGSEIVLYAQTNVCNIEIKPPDGAIEQPSYPLIAKN